MQNAVSIYTTASNYVRNTRTGNPRIHLYSLRPSHFTEEQKVLTTTQSVSQSLDGPAVVGGETTDFSKFVISSKSIREQLPVLVGNKAVASTTPDPTFDGVIPNSSQTRVNDILRKKGLLYEVGTFGTWASAFLKGRSLADQAKGADPDKDMLNNFAEYAFNLNPNASSALKHYQVSQLATNVADGKNYLQLSFTRRIVRTEISYIVAVSDNLSTWDRTQLQVQQVGAPQSNADGITEVVTYRLLALPEVTARKFMRIEITDLAP
ncbi:hypothetical protein [Prosthecobacter sp.]|uniref:hypothetical protein n=1 Tax=Prosthecobacter sp. TaxID=1965333 RepID=UPI003785087B